MVQDDYLNMGVGSEMASYLVHIAKKEGLLGFTAEVHPDNKAIAHLMEKMGFEIKKHFSAGVYLYKISF